MCLLIVVHLLVLLVVLTDCCVFISPAWCVIWLMYICPVCCVGLFLYSHQPTLFCWLNIVYLSVQLVVLSDCCLFINPACCVGWLLYIYQFSLLAYFLYIYQPSMIFWLIFIHLSVQFIVTADYPTLLHIYQSNFLCWLIVVHFSIQLVVLDDYLCIYQFNVRC